mmetsp:Transcript_17566/g.41392  ORF Transcript_17566/g.41392 Transcript_17566/m.41392 type:complete len:432 (+) Transcript_17566:902-2197(+)
MASVLSFLAQAGLELRLALRHVVVVGGLLVKAGLDALEQGPVSLLVLLLADVLANAGCLVRGACLEVGGASHGRLVLVELLLLLNLLELALVEAAKSSHLLLELLMLLRLLEQGNVLAGAFPLLAPNLAQSLALNVSLHLGLETCNFLLVTRRQITELLLGELAVPQVLLLRKVLLQLCNLTTVGTAVFLGHRGIAPLLAPEEFALSASLLLGLGALSGSNGANDMLATVTQRVLLVQGLAGRRPRRLLGQGTAVARDLDCALSGVVSSVTLLKCLALTQLARADPLVVRLREKLGGLALRLGSSQAVLAVDHALFLGEGASVTDVLGRLGHLGPWRGQAIEQPLLVRHLGRVLVRPLEQGLGLLVGPLLVQLALHPVVGQSLAECSIPVADHCTLFRNLDAFLPVGLGLLDCLFASLDNSRVRLGRLASG